MAVDLNINLEELAWFETSPEGGDPDCICSYCGFVIMEWPIRIFRKCDKTEARLHIECYQLLTK